MIKEIDNLKDKIILLVQQTVELTRSLEEEEREHEADMKKILLQLIDQLDQIEVDEANRKMIAVEDKGQREALEQFYQKIKVPILNVLALNSVNRLQAPMNQLPEYSEVLLTVEDASKANGTVLRVDRAAYIQGDQLLRPAGIVVVKNK